MWQLYPEWGLTAYQIYDSYDSLDGCNFGPFYYTVLMIGPLQMRWITRRKLLWFALVEAEDGDW